MSRGKRTTMQKTKRPKWMKLPLWLTLLAIEPNAQVATGPAGNEVVLLGQGIAVSSWDAAQDAIELLQAQSSCEVAS